MLFGASLTSAVSAGVIMVSILAVGLSADVPAERITPRRMATPAAIGTGSLRSLRAGHAAATRRLHRCQLRQSAGLLPWKRPHAVLGKSLTDGSTQAHLVAHQPVGFVLSTPFGIWFAPTSTGARSGVWSPLVVCCAGSEHLTVALRPAEGVPASRRAPSRDAAGKRRGRRARAGESCRPPGACIRTRLLAGSRRGRAG